MRGEGSETNRSPLRALILGQLDEEAARDPVDLPQSVGANPPCEREQKPEILGLQQERGGRVSFR